MKTLLSAVALALAAPTQAAELVSNGGFAGPLASTSITGLYAVGPAAAAGWSLWNSSEGNTTSTLVQSFAGRSNVLRIATNGGYNGAFQYFGRDAQFGSADIWVEAGQAVFIAAADGTVIKEAFTGSTGTWEHVSLDSGAAAFNMITVYSYGGPASFYISGASATPAVPEPATWAMMIVGFGLVGGAMRRRSTKVVYA